MNKINKKIVKSMKLVNDEKYKSKQDEIDKAKKILEDQTRKRKYEKLKKHIMYSRNDLLELKMRTYVKDENRIRKIFGDSGLIEKEKMYDSKGSRKEYQHSYPGKSQWKWKQEELEKQGKVKPEIDEIRERDKKPEIPPEEKKIILFDGEYIGVYNAKVNGYEHGKFKTKVWKEGYGDKVIATIERWKRDEDYEKEVKIKYQEGLSMTIEDLIKAEIHLGVPVYKLIKGE